MASSVKNMDRPDAPVTRARRGGPKVWMIHPVPGIDITDAVRFGVVKYVSSSNHYLYGDEIDDMLPPATLMEDMKTAASLFIPDTDYLLIAGDHAQLVLFTALLATRHKFFRVLRFDRVGRSYFPIQMPGKDDPHGVA